MVALAALDEERFTAYLSVLTLVYFAVALAFKVKRRRNFDFLAVGLALVFTAAILSTLILG